MPNLNPQFPDIFQIQLHFNSFIERTLKKTRAGIIRDNGNNFAPGWLSIYRPLQRFNRAVHFGYEFFKRCIFFPFFLFFFPPPPPGKKATTHRENSNAHKYLQNRSCSQLFTRKDLSTARKPIPQTIPLLSIYLVTNIKNY